MYVDPSRELTPFQEARLEWYAAMDRCAEGWKQDEQEQLRNLQEKLGSRVQGTDEDPNTIKEPGADVARLLLQRECADIR